jgi:hypothetical protein
MHTRKFDEVLSREWAHLKEIRGYADEVPRQSLIGLSISGGGIRSASFGLGVMQALVVKGLMPKFDYLSTVSGGGYIGSALTWLLHIGDKYDLTPQHFPLRGPRWGARPSAESPDEGAGTEQSAADSDKEAPPALDFLRQRGNYLTPGAYLNLVSMMAVVLRGMLSTFLIYFALLASLFYGAIRIGVLPRPVATTPNWPVLLAILGAFLFLLVAFIYAIFTVAPARSATMYRWRTRAQYIQGILLIATIALLVVGSLPGAYRLLDMLGNAVATASLSTLIGAAGAIGKFIMDSQTGATERGPFGKMLISLTTILLAYGTLLLAYSAGVAVTSWPIVFIAVVAAIALLIGFYTNFNYTSPHRMYRDRLMEAFLPDLSAIARTEWQPASGADSAPLQTMCGAGMDQPRYKGPYHIINANVVLVNSQNLKYRDRGSDNFILSPLFCGGDAMGWIDTGSYVAKPKLMPWGRPMTLASAMSISGAAANPHTGRSGGLARNAIVSFLMSMLNLRLGYMDINPDEKHHKALLPKRPNLFFPGLSELASSGFKEESHFIELTDGGHFENTGVYELVRRKLALIVATDSGADDDYAFADLANAIERVRVDFGANIKFRADFDLCDVVGRESETVLTPHRSIRFAKRGYAIADIRYADHSHGTLILIKPTMVQGLPADLYGYKVAEPTFPQQTTADQFFDEAQFESYRELGYQLTKRMVGEVFDNGVFKLASDANAATPAR